jgi:hypothetical protein
MQATGRVLLTRAKAAVMHRRMTGKRQRFRRKYSLESETPSRCNAPRCREEAGPGMDPARRLLYTRTNNGWQGLSRVPLLCAGDTMKAGAGFVIGRSTRLPTEVARRTAIEPRDSPSANDLATCPRPATSGGHAIGGPDPIGVPPDPSFRRRCRMRVGAWWAHRRVLSFVRPGRHGRGRADAGGNAPAAGQLGADDRSPNARPATGHGYPTVVQAVGPSCNRSSTAHRSPCRRELRAARQPFSAARPVTVAHPLPTLRANGSGHSGMSARQPRMARNEGRAPKRPSRVFWCCDQGCSSISPGRHVLLNHGSSGP